MINESNWTFKKHLVCSIAITAITIFTDIIATKGSSIYAFRSIFSKREAASMDIIGGADGPTAFFFSGDPISILLLSKGIFLMLLLLLFVPTKKYLVK